MKTQKTVITWSAKNNSSFLIGHYTAKTIRGAVTEARRYVMGELYGDGTLTIYVNGSPVRQDTKNIFTGGRWVTKSV